MVMKFFKKLFFANQKILPPLVIGTKPTGVSPVIIQPKDEPRFAVVAIYSNTATLYDYRNKKELESLDASYASDEEFKKLYQRCALLNAKHEDDLLYQKTINEL
jgi:hypothetical protein